MSKRVYAIVLEKILQQMEAGVVPWHQPWQSSACPANLVSRRPYRGINRLVLGMTGYSSRYWLSAKQATQLGGRVREGEAYYPVVFWRWMLEEDDPRRTYPTSRYYRVYNLDQCEGIAAPEDPTKPELSTIEACEELVAQYQNGPVVETGKDCAYYMPGKDKVGIPALKDFESAETYYATLLHELVHSTGHTSRLARPGLMSVERFGSQVYSQEELVAEIGAAYLCTDAGISPVTLKQSTAYIAHWLGVLRQDPKQLVHAAQQAQKAADWIKNERHNPVEDSHGN